MHEVKEIYDIPQTSRELTFTPEGSSGFGRVHTSIQPTPYTENLRDEAIKKLIFTAMKLVLELKGEALSLKSR